MLCLSWISEIKLYLCCDFWTSWIMMYRLFCFIAYYHTCMHPYTRGVELNQSHQTIYFFFSTEMQYHSHECSTTSNSFVLQFLQICSQIFLNANILNSHVNSTILICRSAMRSPLPNRPGPNQGRYCYWWLILTGWAESDRLSLCVSTGEGRGSTVSTACQTCVRRSPFPWSATWCVTLLCVPVVCCVYVCVVSKAWTFSRYI